VIVRDVGSGDIEAVAAIYGQHVLTGFGSFESVPPGPVEMGRRITAIRALGLPYLVAEADGRVIGYACASPFRPRVGYRYSAEDSVYVADDAQGGGVGRVLLRAVIERCESLGLRQLLAVIGDSGNAASIGLHAALGFEHMGVARNVGFKHGRWVDIVWMQRALGPGAGAPPDSDGLRLGGG
jgi:phosphinothricin acetyltransferase